MQATNVKTKELWEIYDILLENGHRPVDMIKFIEKRYCEMFMNLLTSKWFSHHVLGYLNLDDIANLDTSVCMHLYRKEWLKCLASFSTSIHFNWANPIVSIVDWIVLKNVKINALSFDFEQSCDQYISDETFQSLMELSHDVKKFLIFGENLIYSLTDHWLQILAYSCALIDTLEICMDDLDEQCADDLVILLESSKYIKYIRLDVCIQSSETNGSPTRIYGTIGKNCPLLEVLELNFYDTTRYVQGCEEIEIFTKGCRNLKLLEIVSEHGGFYDQLIRCLGTYNPSLKSLKIKTNSHLPETITFESLHSLSLGCPHLKSVELTQLIIHAKGLEVFAKNCALLENLDLSYCKLSEKGISELIHLKQLKSIDLFGCRNVTDLFIFNLVRNNPMLEHI